MSAHVLMKIYRDNDTRMNNRLVKVTAVYTQDKTSGRFKRGVSYAKCYKYDGHGATYGDAFIIAVSRLLSPAFSEFYDPQGLPAHSEVA